jgi:hypothetical protein
MNSPVHTWSRGLAATAAVLLLGVGAVACGGGGKPEGGGPGSSTPGSAGVKWAACMRQNGIQVEDPKPGENPKVPDGVSQVLLGKAQKECGKGAGDQQNAGSSQITVTNPKKFQELQAKLFKCQREHGWVQPKPDNGSISVSADDPALALAEKACKPISDEMRKYEKFGQDK